MNFKIFTLIFYIKSLFIINAKESIFKENRMLKYELILHISTYDCICSVTYILCSQFYGLFYWYLGIHHIFLQFIHNPKLPSFYIIFMCRIILILYYEGSFVYYIAKAFFTTGIAGSIFTIIKILASWLIAKISL